MPRNSSLSPQRPKRTKQGTKAGTTKRARGRQVLPSKTHLKEKAARLIKFVPHKLEDLVGGALKDSKTRITAELIEEIRRRTESQLNQLAEELGVDARHPDKWRRAFQELACIYHGVGVISWAQRRGPNRRAAKWTDDHDINLHEMVLQETKTGLTVTDALRKIASDPEKLGKLPRQRKNDRSEKPDNDLRYQTLRKRLSMVQKTSFLEKVLRRACVISADRQVSVAPPELGKSKLQSAPL